MLFLLGILVMGGMSLASGPAPSRRAIKDATYALFAARGENSCTKCHNAQGQYFNILDRDDLIAKELIDLAKPTDSEIYKRLVSGSMPRLAPRFSEAELRTVEEWLKAGAPELVEKPVVVDRVYVSDAKLLSDIFVDLDSLDDRDKPFARYFSAVHLHNNKSVPNEALNAYELGLAKLVNSLSRESQLFRPISFGQVTQIFRVDIRALGWDAALWDAIAAQDPYQVIYDDFKFDAIVQSTGTKTPVIRSDWFAFAAAQPPLYFDILKLPATEEELFRDLGVNYLKNIDNDRVIRAGFIQSGISVNNRVVERHPSRDGYLWKSYDFINNIRERNIFENPLGPVLTLLNPNQHWTSTDIITFAISKKAFVHDASELIFSLPNRLQGYYIANSAGKRLERAPIEIVSDPYRFDRQVVTGISCFRCHNAGINAHVADQIRPTVEANPLNFTRDDRERIFKLYPEKAVYDRAVELDRGRFQGSLTELGVVLKDDPVFDLSQRFELDLDANTAASEIGLPTNVFLDYLRASQNKFGELASLTIPGGMVKRDTFRRLFPEMVVLFNPLVKAVPHAVTPVKPPGQNKLRDVPLVFVEYDAGAGKAVDISLSPENYAAAIQDAVKRTQNWVLLVRRSDFKSTQVPGRWAKIVSVSSAGGKLVVRLVGNNPILIPQLKFANGFWFAAGEFPSE